MAEVNVIQELKQAINDSLVIKAAKENKSPIKGRALTSSEIDQLKANGNVCCDWSKVTVADNFTADNIFRCYFGGNVYIGKIPGDVEKDGKTVWIGIVSSNIIDSEILDDVTIIECRGITNYRIHSGAILSNVGELAMSGKSSFGIGAELPIAIETGGREVYTYPEINVPVAEKIASSRGDKNLISSYESLVDQYKKDASSDKGTVCSKAVIKNCPKIIDTFIGEGALLDNATLIKKTTIYSLTDEQTEISDGAYVVEAIVQWGAEVTSMAIVANSVLTEHSHVERHGKVTDSLIGPNTGVAEGEVTACLVGPFVGFHHQSLLIAAFWPEGKGNVGYGANVGSNHTSKAPDQELWAGEGLFYGLGVNIKFPSDYSNAPYSIIATGVSALPQKLEFPFSLMNTPSAILPGISPAFNELMPGWVLSDNIFTIKRNEGKYMKRNKAKRSDIVFEVFRPDIVDLMIDSRKRLDVSEIKDIYTSRDIKGMGKSYMSERSRQNGVKAYTFYIQYYALSGLLRKLKSLVEENKTDKFASVLTETSSSERFEHERKILSAELPGKTLAEYLDLLSEMEQTIAECVQVSKEKDDKRGVKVIPDYAEAHSPAAEDGFVKETWTKTKATQKEITDIKSVIKKTLANA